MQAQHKVSPRSWLAFELNVLRRAKFTSAVLPFTSNPALGAYLKRWNVRVAANDPTISSSTKAEASIANNEVQLTPDDVDAVLEDAYVPGYKLKNPSLSAWFSETDAWWFDNVHGRIASLSSPTARAIAGSIAIAAGQYVMSFTENDREFRQPLSQAFRRLWSIQPKPFDNHSRNTASNKSPDDFVAECFADLLFLRLPSAHGQTTRAFMGRNAWAEEWLRGGNEFWNDFESSMTGRLGAPTETKSQYLRLVDELLRKASHIEHWAIAHVETGFITTQDIVDTISKIRRVDTVYTKDFSELSGTKAVIITA
ncbi:MAG TPA: hypothetical protein PLP07_03075 [Pyrinomonadaceae bacterium]|nr:hypothetical protein [Chloracidobacterium sp.]MBP9934924.1 hypothetical protein [Pyrinomonadaceae bacterium]MBK7803352.1 hypothetical protein [Chloracidobacterium sp.]MBK9438600.1 hypothetical protein [Chloracidobacterium sp.]MBK9766650.1 hypothetical protein [Chloracidobacterium sp.]